MKVKRQTYIAILLLPSLTGLSACSMLDNMRVENVSDNVQYRDKSQTVANLELPPGLTKPEFNETYVLSQQNTRSTQSATKPLDQQRPQPLQQTASRSAPQEPKTAVTLTQLDDGNPALAVGAGFEQVWLQTGTVLGRLGIDIVNEQRDVGIYSITLPAEEQSQQQSGNFLRRLMQSVSRDGTEADETVYRLIVGDVSENKTLLLVSDDQGKPLDKTQATQILERLQAAF